ncbi:MAG: hypothetical protein IPK00_24685 [Deltaproteobacteria bacterium]|nr:hypothetical protein [Deltaproteobacteria bacterium]
MTRVSPRWAVLGTAWLVGCASTGGERDRSYAIRFESGIGRPAFEARSNGDAIEVLDAEGRLLASLAREREALLVLDDRNRPLGRVVERPDDEDFRLLWLAPDGTPGFGLERETDGDLELEDAEGETVYELKARDYGFKVVDGRDEPALRVRRSENGKISVRDSEDVTYLVTRDVVPTEVAAVWALPELDFMRATGFAVALWIESTERP